MHVSINLTFAPKLEPQEANQRMAKATQISLPRFGSYHATVIVSHRVLGPFVGNTSFPLLMIGNTAGK